MSADDDIQVYHNYNSPWYIIDIAFRYLSNTMGIENDISSNCNQGTIVPPYIA